MAGTRDWKRVEAPWTLRGHAMVASFDDETYTAWELPNGRWSLVRGVGTDTTQVRAFKDFTMVRRAAEKSHRNRPPVAGARDQNPGAPYSRFADVWRAEQAVRTRLPAGWAVGPVRCSRDGTLFVTVRGGLGPRAVALLGSFPFPVRVLEANQ